MKVFWPSFLPIATHGRTGTVPVQKDAAINASLLHEVGSWGAQRYPLPHFSAAKNPHAEIEHTHTHA